MILMIAHVVLRSSILIMNSPPREFISLRQIGIFLDGFSLCKPLYCPNQGEQKESKSAGGRWYWGLGLRKKQSEFVKVGVVLVQGVFLAPKEELQFEKKLRKKGGPLSDINGVIKPPINGEGLKSAIFWNQAGKQQSLQFLVRSIVGYICTLVGLYQS